MPRRTTRTRPDPVRAQAAAQRLAQLAAGLGATEPAPPTEPAPDEWWADHTRVSGVAPPAPADVAPEPVAPPALPVAGRHAARRRRPRLLAGTWSALRGRLPMLGVGHVAVVAVTVAVGLALTTWWVLRDQPETITAVSAEPAAPLLADASDGASPSPSPSAAPGGGASDGTVTVDVAGKVRRPGIVVLAQGARVTDALQQAGGARKGVDLTSINLARLLVDGEQIVVGAPSGAAAAAPGPASTAQPGGGGQLVNLNLASPTELEALPQVGPVTAQAIVAWREQHGGFTRVDELLEIDGIGAKTLERLAPHVTV